MKKLKRRKEVRHWIQSVCACADGGGSRAKSTCTALGLISSQSLPYSKQQLVQKAANFGEHVIDSNKTGNHIDQFTVVEQTICIVAKDSVADTVKRLALSNKQISTCLRLESETLPKFVERFIAFAQSYVNLRNTDLSSVKSQNFKMRMLSNEKFSDKIYSSVSNNFEMSAENKNGESSKNISLFTGRV